MLAALQLNPVSNVTPMSPHIAHFALKVTMLTIQTDVLNVELAAKHVPLKQDVMYAILDIYCQPFQDSA